VACRFETAPPTDVTHGNTVLDSVVTRASTLDTPTPTEVTHGVSALDRLDTAAPTLAVQLLDANELEAPVVNDWNALLLRSPSVVVLAYGTPDSMDQGITLQNAAVPRLHALMLLQRNDVETRPVPVTSS
jgi:hypothetical protein